MSYTGRMADSPRRYTGTTEEARLQVADATARLEELRARYPSWKIWNVPRVGPGGSIEITWHLQPRQWPHDFYSAEELETAIRDTYSPPTC